MLPIVVQVRDRTLARVGQLAEEDLYDLQLFPTKNDVGTWSLKLPHLVRDASGKWVRHALCEELATPGSGIVAALPGGRRFSGPMLTPEFDASTSDPGGTWTFTGVSDMIVLSDRAAYPAPTIADAQASSAASAYDIRTDSAETLMLGYVSDNIGPTATTSRRDSRISVAANGGRGSFLTKSARFPTLLALCQELSTVDGLLFDVVQIDDRLQFGVSTARDLTGSVRMDIQGDQLASTKFSYSAPDATTVIVLGQGDGADRTIRTRTNPDAVAASEKWGRVVERIVDQRQTDDNAELDSAGDALLVTDGTEIQSVDVTPSDANAKTLGVAWWLGDLVTVTVAGQPIKADVSKIRIAVSKDGIYAGATVGDPVGFDADQITGNRVSNVETRVSNLEVNSGSGAPPYDDAPLKDRVATLEARPTAGLVQVTPTSVGVSSGTASVSDSGTITFSGASALMLNGIFDATHRRYLIKLTLSGSDSYLMGRFAAAGVATTAAAYYYVLSYAQGTQVANASTANGSANQYIGYAAAAASDGAEIALEIANPKSSTPPPKVRVDGSYNSTSHTRHFGSGVYNGTGTFDGYYVFPVAGTLTGTATVYAYVD